MSNRAMILPASVGLLALSLLAGCQRAVEPAAEASNPAAAAAQPATSDQAPAPGARAAEAQAPEPASTQLPADFRQYAATPVGDGRVCVVGAASNGDEPVQRPYVAIKGGNGPVAWAKPLAGIEGMYQTRATHCAVHDGTLYVLLQSDTHSQQSLSQTQLSVASLPADGGEAVAETIVLPNVQDKAYSAWVDPGATNFEASGKGILARGHYVLVENRDQQNEFELRLGLDLKPAQ